MSTEIPSQQPRIELTFTVANQAQAREMDLAWREIISGRKLERINALEHDDAEVMERARTALITIEQAIRNNTTTGQAGRLIRFLAGVYNGDDYPFDLTDLRPLDTKLANACLDYLNYDRLGKVEVHRHLSGGEGELHEWMRAIGIFKDARQ